MTIELPQSQFPINIYASTFGIEDILGNKLVHFGFVIPGRFLGSWACVFDCKAIEVNKEGWLRYLNEIGFPEKEESFDFRSPPSAMPTGVPYSNLIALSRTGELAEIRLYSFSMGDVVEDRRSLHTGKVTGQGVGIVRCSLDLQRQLIIAIYGEPIQ